MILKKNLLQSFLHSYIILISKKIISLKKPFLLLFFWKKNFYFEFCDIEFGIYSQNFEIGFESLIGKTLMLLKQIRRP